MSRQSYTMVFTYITWSCLNECPDMVFVLWQCHDFGHLLVFPALCITVISCINMIVHMTAYMFVFCTGTLGSVNMRLSCRCVVWRLQQWSSVTIIRLKQSRYIYSSTKHSLNRFNPNHITPLLLSKFTHLQVNRFRGCWSRIRIFITFLLCYLSVWLPYSYTQAINSRL